MPIEIVAENSPDTYTLRDVAEIIGKTYHTVRNMTLRGEFGELQHGRHTYVTRRGLLDYLYTQIRASRELHDALVAQSRQLRSIEDGAEPDEFNAITREPSAFQNIADAFAAMVDVVARNHVESETTMRELIQDIAGLEDDGINPMREIAARTENRQIDALRMLEELPRLLHQLRHEMTRIATIVTGPLPNARPMRDLSFSPSAAGAPISSSHNPSTYTQSLLRELAELNATHILDVATQIPDDRPYQIVEVLNGQLRTVFRTRRALSVGQAVIQDVTGDLMPAPNALARDVVGTVVSIHDQDA